MADKQAIDTGTTTATTSPAKSAAAPATAAPANSAPRTAGLTDPGVTRAGGQPTTKPATAQPAKSLTGGVDSDTVTNLVQTGIFKRMRAILGDTTAEVADKIATTAKKLWNDFVEFNVEHVKSANEILRRIISSLTKPAMIVIKPITKFVKKRLGRVRDRYKNIKNGLQDGGQSSAVNLEGPGVTNTGAAAAVPPQQASSSSRSALSSKRGTLKRAWAAANMLRDVAGVPRLGKQPARKLGMAPA